MKKARLSLPPKDVSILVVVQICAVGLINHIHDGSLFCNEMAPSATEGFVKAWMNDLAW